MIKLFLIAAAIAASTTTTHITGKLATSGTNGWMQQRVLDLNDGVSAVSVSASANGKNTYLTCIFTDPSGAVYKDTHVQLCQIKTPKLTLPWHLTVTLINDNPGPVTFDIEVQNTK